jgi:hypothetical protein
MVAYLKLTDDQEEVYRNYRDTVQLPKDVFEAGPKPPWRTKFRVDEFPDLAHLCADDLEIDVRAIHWIRVDYFINDDFYQMDVGFDKLYEPPLEHQPVIERPRRSIDL